MSMNRNGNQTEVNGREKVERERERERKKKKRKHSNPVIAYTGTLLIVQIYIGINPKHNKKEEQEMNIGEK